MYKIYHSKDAAKFAAGEHVAYLKDALTSVVIAKLARLSLNGLDGFLGLFTSFKVTNFDHSFTEDYLDPQKRPKEALTRVVIVK